MTSIPGGTSDRQLLEWAAKAYWGEEIDDVVSVEWGEQDQAILYTHGDNQDHNGCDRAFCWNPRSDYGAALELSVKLRLDIEHGSPLDNSRYVMVSRCGVEMMRDPVSVIEEFEDESGRIDALCLAITRAAAEIGKAMK